MFLGVLVVFLCVFTMCSAQDDDVIDRRIAGAHVARPKQFPYAVFVNVSYRLGDEGCTGSLIKANWVVTAAHCFVNAARLAGRKYKAQVTAGAAELNDTSTAQVRTSAQVLAHDLDPVRDQRDIALVRVDPPFTITLFVVPITLVWSRPMPLPSKPECYTVGYGTEKTPGKKDDITGETKKSMRLYFAKGFLVDCKEVRRDVKWWGSPDRLCVESVLPGAAVCGGDAGGPLVCQGQLSGVLHGSVDAEGNVTSVCGGDNKYHHYMSTHYFAAWIKKHVIFARADYSSSRRNTASYSVIVLGFTKLIVYHKIL